MNKILLTLCLAFALSACSNKSEGTSTGNPLVAIQFKSYTALMAADISPQAVSDLKMCFKRLRFKPISGLDENVDLALGEVAVDPAGTLLAAVRVPAGTYTRVEFDLNPDCTSGKSIQLTNSSGSFSTHETITIRFDGTLILSASQDLDLDMQSIITALNTVTSDLEIKTKAESVGGSF